MIELNQKEQHCQAQLNEQQALFTNERHQLQEQIGKLKSLEQVLPDQSSLHDRLKDIEHEFAALQAQQSDDREAINSTKQLKISNLALISELDELKKRMRECTQTETSLKSQIEQQDLAVASAQQKQRQLLSELNGLKRRLAESEAAAESRFTQQEIAAQDEQHKHEQQTTKLVSQLEEVKRELAEATKANAALRDQLVQRNSPTNSEQQSQLPIDQPPQNETTDGAALLTRGSSSPLSRLSSSRGSNTAAVTTVITPRPNSKSKRSDGSGLLAKDKTRNGHDDSLFEDDSSLDMDAHDEMEQQAHDQSQPRSVQADSQFSRPRGILRLRTSNFSRQPQHSPAKRNGSQANLGESQSPATKRLKPSPPQLAASSISQATTDKTSPRRTRSGIGQGRTSTLTPGRTTTTTNRPTNGAASKPGSGNNPIARPSSRTSGL